MHITSSCKVKARGEKSLQEIFFTFCGRKSCQNSTKQIGLCIERGVFGVDTSVEVGNHLDSHEQKRIWNQVWSVCLLLGFVRTLWSICSYCSILFRIPLCLHQFSNLSTHSCTCTTHTMVCDASRFNALIRSSRLSPPITWSTFFKLWCATDLTHACTHIQDRALGTFTWYLDTRAREGGRADDIELYIWTWRRYIRELFIEYCKLCQSFGVIDT